MKMTTVPPPVLQAFGLDPASARNDGAAIPKPSRSPSEGHPNTPPEKGRGVCPPLASRDPPPSVLHPPEPLRPRHPSIRQRPCAESPPKRTAIRYFWPI